VGGRKYSPDLAVRPLAPASGDWIRNASSDE
jgi:hypothetical protein